MGSNVYIKPGENRLYLSTDGTTSANASRIEFRAADEATIKTSIYELNNNLYLSVPNGTLFLGDGTPTNLELGASGTSVDINFLGGGTITSSGNALDLGYSGDTINLNVTGVTYNFPSSIITSSTYTAADILTKIKTVDGTGSGLDADLLDGQHGAYYAADSAVVKLTGDQTIAGTKTFSSTITGSVSGTSANVTGTVAVANGGTGNTSVDTTPTSASTKMVTSGGVLSYVDGKIFLKSDTDNRSVATTPNDYNYKFEIKGLKTNSVIGLSSGSTYSALLGIRGWSDSSGGNSHELAFDGATKIYHRSGSATSWGSWTSLIESDDSRLSDARTPTAHAVNANTYGYGDGTNAGHLRVGNNIDVSTGTISIPQSVATTATPTFGSMTLGSAVVSTTNGLAISGAYLNPTTVGNAGNLYIRTTDALAADVGGVLTFGGSYTAAGSETKFAAIAGRKENATDGNYAGYLTFLTRANGSTPSEAMRITSDRRVGIRTQYPSATVEIASAASSGKIVSVLDNDDYPVFNISGTLLENTFIISMGDTGSAQNGTCAKIDDGNEQITLNGSSIILPKFTSAGFVKTNASGLLSVDTASYVPNTDLLRAASTSLISATANSGTVSADVCSISLKANSYYKVSIAGYFYTNLSGTLSQVSLVLPSATGSPSFRGQYTRGLSTAATLTTYPVYTAATSITYTIVDSSRSTNPEFFGIDCIVYSGTADTTLVVRVISTYTGTTRITSAMAGSSITAVKVA